MSVHGQVRICMSYVSNCLPLYVLSIISFEPRGIRRVCWKCRVAFSMQRRKHVVFPFRPVTILPGPISKVRKER